mmetsp:Transcript_14971/g.13146  ORF Transcript_14971/g.13146 Transcript_14971/m.13146 type:complete len:196 (+) Transcript_14971:156-743(+)
MGLAGHIQSVYIGIYKHRKGNKRKRRTIFYSIVSYKSEMSVENALKSDSIQHKIDHLRQAEAEPELDPLSKLGMKENTEEEKQEFIDQMEDGGFTIVLPTNEKSQRKFVSDGATTIQAASMIKARKLQEKLAKIEDVDEDEVNKKRRRQRKELYKNDFYKFQIKEVKKDAILDLRKGFELDKIKLVTKKRRKIQE